MYNNALALPHRSQDDVSIFDVSIAVSVEERRSLYKVKKISLGSSSPYIVVNNYAIDSPTSYLRGSWSQEYSSYKNS